MLFLLPTALAFAPGLTPTPRARVTTRALAPVCVDGSLVAEMSDQAKYAGAAAAALFLGGGLYMGQIKPKTASPPAAPAPAAAAPVAAPVEPPPPAAPVGDWYKGKRSLGTHRSAGRWPGDAKRTVWVPPPGWVKPTKPVQSWYDKGERLTPPVAAKAAKAAAAKPANFFDQVKAFFDQGDAAPSSPARPTTDWYKGKRSLGTHRSAGRWPGDAKRELWVPPPGWQPASKAATAKPAEAGVKSWYDSGARLGPNGVNY